MEEPQYNSYPVGSQAPKLSDKGIETISGSRKPENSDISFGGLLNYMKNGILESKNFISGSVGWFLSSDGTWEFNPSPITSRCRVYLNADATITAGGARKILFDTIGSVGYDNLSEFDLVTNNRFTATNAGRYLVAATVKVDPSAADKFFELSFQVSGTTLSRKAEYSKNGNTFSIHLTDILELTAGQYIEVYIDSDEAANYTAKGVQRTFLAIHRLS